MPFPTHFPEPLAGYNHFAAHLPRHHHPTFSRDQFGATSVKRALLPHSVDFFLGRLSLTFIRFGFVQSTSRYVFKMCYLLLFCWLHKVLSNNKTVGSSLFAGYQNLELVGLTSCGNFL